MVRRDPGSQDIWILFRDLTLTHGMVSAHLFIPPEDTEKTVFASCFHTSIAAALSRKAPHLQADPHASRTPLADATTPASLVLHVPPAHCRVGETASLVPVGTRALPALFFHDTLCWFVRATQK